MRRARGIFRFALLRSGCRRRIAYSAAFLRLIFKAIRRDECSLTFFGPPHARLAELAVAAMAVVILPSPGVDGLHRRHHFGPAAEHPPELYASGASSMARALASHLLITCRSLKPVPLFAFVLSIIGTMQLFAEPFPDPRTAPAKRPPRRSALTFYRQGFTAINFGYASASPIRRGNGRRVLHASNRSFGMQI